MSITDYKVISFNKTENNHIQDFVTIINDHLEMGYTLKGPTLMSWFRKSRCIFKQNLVKYSSQPSSTIKEFNLLYFETDCESDGGKRNLDAIKTFEESIMKMIKCGFVLYEGIQIYDRYNESGDGKSVNLQALVKYESTEKNLMTYI